MIKNCASRWSFTKNRNTMHGQQNVKHWLSSYYRKQIREMRDFRLPQRNGWKLRVVVTCYRRFGILDLLRWDRWSVPKRRYEITATSCVMSQYRAFLK
jgi:ribosomal protein L35